MESRGQPLTYLDTHAALWLATCEAPFSEAALLEIESSELRISPRVVFEMQLLREIGRLNAGPVDFLAILRREESFRETWTRDPFDPFIVSQAAAGGGKRITRDRRIQEHFQGAVWQWSGGSTLVFFGDSPWKIWLWRCPVRCPLAPEWRCERRAASGPDRLPALRRAQPVSF